ncbi:conjugal transfer protein TraG N-terminal domain-containing protein [Geoalkalibacter halelectricus]|uniref:Conjugal transfer protein TraG N-terminal domain-containing protein n=1 Tax=Geoalkalibacter halelectricus TaxID=2847045 RepID=A0ABY5ZJT4_9BACT|nr:conjugal transfer protein TraG N-terminal domain-containing protein [Geoalkalibacter halelectricus]MDO3377096.1 conjugal transfer protein TraG N-terminal domain-containing protein [Geoalkalibacter halelectricus]UWZ79407.1 conjugal transfer protein TraG N-terminal domain-containing protein [Geoalkalibacter halelectricus]
MAKTYQRLLVSLVVVALVPQTGLALEMDYYTFGGHEAVVSAFSKVALIFSDNGYKTLFYVVISLAIFLGAMTAFYRGLTGARFNPVAWVVPLVVGLMIYAGLVVPKGTLHIYDNVTNRYQPVSGIPDGLVMIAGLFSLFENGLVEIVSTAADPLSYQNQAGGLGLLGLFKATTFSITAEDSLMDTSFNRFIDDCVSFELVRPGSELTVDELRRTTTDLRASLSKAWHPSNFTVHYSRAVPRGQTLSCTEAWERLDLYLANMGNFEGNLHGLCAQIGFDYLDAVQYQRCKGAIEDTLSLLGVQMSSEDFIRQAYLAERLESQYRAGLAHNLANYHFIISATGTMKAANEWLPILRAVLTAIAVGLIPFLALFIPTPLFGKALAVMLGFFIWLSAWGVTDAIVHGFAMDFANSAFEKIRRFGPPGSMGMDALYFAPGETIKVLAMFGTLRMSGLMLATVMTGMLVRFGGHALASLSGNVTGQVQSAGVTAARQTEDPAGRAEAIQSNVKALPTQAWSNEHDFASRMAAERAFMDELTGGRLALGREAFAQGHAAKLAGMGATDAFLLTGDPRGSAALGASQMRAPRGVISTPANQRWIEYATPDGSQRTLKSGPQGLALSEGELTAVSGLPNEITYSTTMSAAYSTAIADMQSEVARHDQTTGNNLLRNETRSDGTSSIDAAVQKYGVSAGTAHELSEARVNAARTVLDNATSITDEKGNVVSKEAVGQVIATATAQTPFGSIAPIKVEAKGLASYAIKGVAKDGTTQTYTVNVGDQDSVERKIGESWRDTTSRLQSSDISANDQRALGNLLQVTGTRFSTELGSNAWQRQRTLEARQSEDTNVTLANRMGFDTAFLRWYGDKWHGLETNPVQRYANAFSQLNRLVNEGNREKVGLIIEDYAQDRSLVPRGEDARGSAPALSKPSPPPVDLERGKERYAQTRQELETERNNMEAPREAPQNVPERIAAGETSAGLKAPDPQLERYLDLMRDNVDKAGVEMGKFTDAPAGPLGQLVPEELGGFRPPNARDTKQGRIKENLDPLKDSGMSNMEALSRSGKAIWDEAGPGKAAERMEQARDRLLNPDDPVSPRRTFKLRKPKNRQ